MAEKVENQNFGIVGPLNFLNQNLVEKYPTQLYPIKDIPCLFCEEKFTFYEEKNQYLAHLYVTHRLIIADEHQIAILHEYLLHWREIFQNDEKNIPTYCTMMLMDQLPNGQPSKNEKYFLLCDVLQRDYDLRNALHKKRLDMVLQQHQIERTDTEFERCCLFCREVIKPIRSNYIEHLYQKHFFQLGKSENLVFIDDLIDTVQAKIDELICIFCEKKFKNRPTLKEHMRKKGHKRINPHNEIYDRFYLVNYQEQTTTTKKSAQKKSQKKTKPNHNHHEKSSSDSSDSNWSDWEGDEQLVTCLFCSNTDPKYSEILKHMMIEHQVDFESETTNLKFYDKVKIVNFVRRATYSLQCIKCKKSFQNIIELQNHLKTNDHYTLGSSNEWNSPQYFFPIYDDDVFLQHLDNSNFDDDITDDANELTVTVYTEDTDPQILFVEQMKINDTE